MAAVLELDQGNTRCKWRVLATGADGAGSVVARGAFATQAWKDPTRLPGAWRDAGVSRVRVANVAGKALEDVIAKSLQRELGVAVEFARVSPECAGVVCAYGEPARLGVDRWLAVLAAHHRDPSPALIVDCGSAVTLDLLGVGGSHLGGYIVPGLGLMRRALYQDTDAVKVGQAFAPGMSLAPGRDTADAVNRGLPLMVLGVIERAHDELRQLRRADAVPGVWLTGGDAALVASLAPLAGNPALRLVEDLVMDGLALTNP